MPRANAYVIFFPHRYSNPISYGTAKRLSKRETEASPEEKTCKQFTAPQQQCRTAIQRHSSGSVIFVHHASRCRYYNFERQREAWWTKMTEPELCRWIAVRHCCWGAVNCLQVFS